MKYGIYYAYWEKKWAANYVPYVSKVAKLGFDILEIGGAPLPDYTDDQISELRKTAKDNNISLTVGYGPTYEHNIGSSDPSIRDNALDWYKKLFEVMAKLDSHLIGGALYSYWPIDYSKPIDKENDLKYSIEGIKKLSEIAMPYDINLGMEVLNRFENHILNTAEEGVSFVKAVGSDNVKVMLDTFHMNIEETSIAGAIHTAGSYLGHLHTGECNRRVPGKGRMAWREIGEALRDIGYNGTVVMEPFVNRGGEVERDIHIWHDMEPGITAKQLDKDAADALAFEKYMLENN